MVSSNLKELLCDNKNFSCIETAFRKNNKNIPLFGKVFFEMAPDYKFIGNLSEDDIFATSVFAKDFNISDIKNEPQNDVKRSFYKLAVSNDIDFYSIDKNPTSNIPIDVIIPTCSKDIKKLKFVINAIKENVKHPINNIFVVSPKNEIIEGEKEYTFVDENTVLPFTCKDINYKPDNVDRSGWIFQQLLKLSADKISSCEQILIVDSDTIFSIPQIFVDSDKMTLNCSDEYHQPYFTSYQKLTGFDKRFELSFVAHHMLFNRTYLKELKSFIEGHTNKIWYDAILDNLDPNEGSSFSEYELYGNYMYLMHRDLIKLRYWYNLSLKKECFDCLLEDEKRSYKAISAHSYNRKKSLFEKFFKRGK